jgi:ATP-dependent DNA helicase
VDTRKYLEDRVVERLTKSNATTPAASRKPSSEKKKVKKTVTKKEESDSEEEVPLRQFVLRTKAPAGTEAPKNAFQAMMGKRSTSIGSAKAGSKRKSTESMPTPVSKSAKSSRSSTPATSIRGRKRKGRQTYIEADATDEDELSDDEFEQKLAEEAANESAQLDDTDENLEESEHAKILEQASKSTYVNYVHLVDI